MEDVAVGDTPQGLCNGKCQVGLWGFRDGVSQVVQTLHPEGSRGHWHFTPRRAVECGTRRGRMRSWFCGGCLGLFFGSLKDFLLMVLLGGVVSGEVSWF